MSIFLKLYLSIIFQKRLLIQFPPTTATWRTMVIQCQTFFAPFTKSSSGMNWQKLVRKWFLHLTLQTQEENHNRLFQGISISHTEYWPWKHVYWILLIIMFLQISEACSESRLRLKAEGNHYGIQSSGRWQGNEVTNLEDMQITINNIFFNDPSLCQVYLTGTSIICIVLEPYDIKSLQSPFGSCREFDRIYLIQNVNQQVDQIFRI